MPLGFIFWMIVIVAVVLNWPAVAAKWPGIGGWVQFVLICILGWKCFGPVVQ